MEEIEDDIVFLKGALKSLLVRSSGESTIYALEKIFAATYGKIDFQRYRVNSLIEFLKKFPDDFKVTENILGTHVSLHSLSKKPLPSAASSYCGFPSSPVYSFHPEALSVDKDFMIERFLAFDWDDTTTQDKGISPNDELKTSLVNSDVSTLLPSIFNETNPFLNDILQSWNLQDDNLETIAAEAEYDPIEEFWKASKTLKVEKFNSPNAITTLTDDETTEPSPTNYKNVERFPRMNPLLNDPFAYIDYNELVESDTSDEEYYELKTPLEKKNKLSSTNEHADFSATSIQKFKLSTELTPEEKVEMYLQGTQAIANQEESFNHDIIEDEFDALEAVREKLCIHDNDKEGSYVDSLETLSSISDEIKKQTHAGNSDNSTVYEMGYKNVAKLADETKLPFDDPIFCLSYPPHNRDHRLCLPPREKLPEKFEGAIVYLSEIFSATHFWFHTEESIKILEAMNNKIDDFYLKLESNELGISEKNIKKGLIVLAFHQNFGFWYRARVNKISGKNIHLYYMDYGTADRNKIGNLKYLLKEFLEIPPLSYRGRIYGVMPYNEFFTIEQQEKFIVEAANDSFRADLMYYDEEQDIYELKLTFTDTQEDASEWMLEDDVGQLIPEDMMLKNRGNKEHTIGPMCYLLPTHELLENGKFPSYETLLDHSKKGCNLSTFIETNYFNAHQEITPDMKDMLNNYEKIKNITKGISAPKKKK